MPLISKCLICNHELHVDKEISCDKCKLPLHSTCSGLSRSEIQCLTSKDRRIAYHCNKCTSASSEVSELKQLILDLKSEIDNLKKSAAFNNANQLTPEAVITEVAERQRRASNVIVFNLEESDADTAPVRAAADKEQITKIIRKLPSVSSDSIQIFRLGRAEAGKIRPLKVILRTPADALEILRNKNKLKTNNQNINFKSDETQMQRNYLAQLRSELQERQQRGENGITIKYVHGVPKIVTKN